MRTGAILSAAGHGAILAMVVFGLPWFSPSESPAIRVTEVSFVSEAEFAAAQSAASAPRDPEAPAEAPAPAAPEVLVEPELPPAPDRPEPEPAPAPEIATLEPRFNPAAPLAPAPEGVTLVAPSAPTVVGPPRPRPVERIDATPAPAPPEVAQPAETVTPEQSAEPAPERLAAAAPAAPPEAAPEPQSAPEPPEAAAPSGAVAASAPPRPRPARPAPPREVAAAPAPAAPAPPSPEAPPSPPAPEAPQAPSPAARIAEMVRQQQAAAQGEGTVAATSLPEGPPITSAERDGLKLAVQRCWNVPAGLRDAQELKVTLAAELDAQGGVIAGSIRLIEPAAAPDGRFQQAYEAGRRALIRCSPYTDLPREKYAQWRNIEVVFNPEGMVSW